MTEKILRIEEAELKLDGEWSTFEGYRIVTTDQDIYILIDHDQQCCEVSGYLSTPDDKSEFIGADLVDVTITESPSEPIRSALTEKGVWIDSESCMFVDIVTNLGSLQFAVYNEHNGYYSHAVRIISKQLEESTRL